MERIDIGDWCTLYHADSAEIMDMLLEHKPDAVIMDPPYGIAHVMKGGWGKAFAKEKVLQHGPIVGDDRGADLSPWLGMNQVLLWGADHLRAQLPAGGRFLVWDKAAGNDFSRQSVLRCGNGVALKGWRGPNYRPSLERRHQGRDGWRSWFP